MQEAENAFFARINHEIQTPVSGILEAVDLIAETPLDDRQQTIVATLKSRADSLLALVNNLLDLSQLEAGKLTLEERDFDLVSVIHGSMDLMAERAQRKGIEIIMLIPDDIETQLRGDPDRLIQIVLNMLSHAIHFTDEGEVFLEIEQKENREEVVEILCSVRNTGPGISDSAKASLFLPLTQGDGMGSRKHGDADLGLSICKHLVEMMKGQFGVNSDDGKGTTFWWLARFDRALKPKPQAIPDSSPLSGRKVLVVDDNETSCGVLRHYLESWGMQVDCVSSGNEALESCDRAEEGQQPYQVILMDMEMPDANGLELAESMRAAGLFDETELMMLAPFYPVVESAELKKGGGVHHLTKPVRRGELRECLLRVFGERMASTQSSSDDPDSPAPRFISLAKEAEPRPPTPGKILLVEDNVANQKVAQAYFKALGVQIDLVRDGAEALGAFKSGAYRLIFMDCQMPIMDGYEATRRIRAEEKAQRLEPVRIVAITAHAMAGDRERCLAAGMDDYLAKPFNKQGLGEMIQRHSVEVPSEASG